MNENLCIKAMTIEAYDKIYSIWCSIPGIGLSNADSKKAIEKYLKRNPNMSFSCYDGNKIVGTILCGHDGRRGYIHHTCVLSEYRGKNIGKKLVEKALEVLKNEGIDKCHLFVFCDNEVGKNFWKRLGWEKRSDLLVYSMET